MANTLMVIVPYRYQDLWVFDDDRVGLVREPFVSGIPEMIDWLVEGIPKAEQGFTLLLAQNPFPDYQAELTWQREEFGGNWYSWGDRQMEGWLCPALFKYFAATPATIYCKAEALRSPA